MDALKSPLKPYWLPVIIVLAQVGLCVVAFRDFRMNPGEVVFCEYGDGLKNLYTLLQWVKEPLSPRGFFHFSSLNYPYGDAIWFTDCTPLFAVPFKWWCLHVQDVSQYTIPLYQLFLLLNFPLCGLLLYKLFRRLDWQRPLCFALALVLPWINPMVLRLPRGHFNLSFSVLIVALLYLLLRWYQRSTAGKTVWPTALWLGLLLLTGFGIHGYYLPLLGISAGIALGVYSLVLPHGSQKRKALLGALLVPGIAGGITLLLLSLTDPYQSLRNHQGMGYDWMEIKMRATSLFSSYSFTKWGFPVRGTLNYDEPERAGYLGTALLLTTAGLAVLYIGNRNFRAVFKTVQQQFWASPFYRSVAVMGFLLLMISFGEHYFTDEFRGLEITNLLNPFYYLHKFTHQVEHFRALGRFVWPFWFAAAIWWGYTLSALWRAGAFTSAGRLVVPVVTGIFLLTDTKSTINWLQNAASAINYFSPAALQQVAPLPAGGKGYCAILPLPYYHVGSETMPLTVDDIEPWSRLNFQWSVKSGLPLMASKMSRTPPVQAQNLIAFLSGDAVTQTLAAGLQARPLLIAADQKLLSDTAKWTVTRESGTLPWEAYLRILAFPQRHQLAPFARSGEINYYRWQLPVAK